ncbi:MAG: enoyl-CoA hydratase-related protein, partial [Acetobacteraceae bacterium]
MTQDLLFEVTDGVAVMTLNRPDKLNAFTGEMLRALIDALDESEAREDVRVAVLTGAGRGFCSGGDVGGMGGAAENRPHVTKNRIWKEIQAIPNRAARFEKP